MKRLECIPRFARECAVMPYTPILATLGYVLSPDRRRVLMIHRNLRDDDHQGISHIEYERAANVMIVGE